MRGAFREAAVFWVDPRQLSAVLGEARSEGVRELGVNNRHLPLSKKLLGGERT